MTKIAAYTSQLGQQRSWPQVEHVERAGSQVGWQVVQVAYPDLCDTERRIDQPEQQQDGPEVQPAQRFHRMEPHPDLTQLDDPDKQRGDRLGDERRPIGALGAVSFALNGRPGVSSHTRTAGLLSELQLPYVSLDRPAGASSGPAICLDDTAGIRAAVQHLIDLGHRRIAHVAGPADTCTPTAVGTSGRWY